MSAPPDDRTRLLLVAGRDPRHEISGGHSAYVRSHARAAIRLGFAPVLLCVGETGDREWTDYGEVVRVPTAARPLRQTRIAAHAAPLAHEIARQVESGAAPAFVHGFSLWSAAALVARDRLRRRGHDLRFAASLYTTYLEQSRSQRRGLMRALSLRSWALTVGEELWIRAVCDRVERRMARAADRLWVNYQGVAELVEASHGPGLPIRRLTYAPETAFADDAARAPAGIPRGPAGRPLHILSVARQDPRKANDLLVRALARLRSEGLDVRATLVGGGRLLGDIRRLVNDLGLADRVEVPGVVDDIEPLQRSADVFVLSTRAEQSGSVAVLEAMQAGLPIVASAVDGLLEDLTDGLDALLVAPRDAEALATGLRRALGDPELRRRLGAGARRTFERRFSAPVFAHQLAAAYAEIGITNASPARRPRETPAGRPASPPAAAGRDADARGSRGG